jgi:ribose transport system substrate-binding protein
MRAGITSEFKEFGGAGIQYSFVNVSIAQWGTGLKPAVEKAMAADPKLSYIICIYDSMTEFVVPAIAGAKKDGKIKVIGFNGTPMVLDMVRAGKVEMTIGECQEWTSYAITDAEMRLIGGMGAVKNMHIPFRIFDKSNAAEAGVPATYDKGYGDTFKADYAKLWGL